MFRMRSVAILFKAEDVQLHSAMAASLGNVLRGCSLRCGRGFAARAHKRIEKTEVQILVSFQGKKQTKEAQSLGM